MKKIELVWNSVSPHIIIVCFAMTTLCLILRLIIKYIIRDKPDDK